eukprot:gnl/TRDRNA2_/TRDRNA2_158497_c0_seq2.p1 gnl/TRDRNA2_/TRDRNA2_158497_c0~~gnl/TRDRNA2_/TRDRNA2_158497_c0_seq2.p1  ORF type:complete len:439 (-),score=64.54 gnl/TRDRNA2_/TRDRNA2_158497_c0_seq2:265-1581(-)
MRHGSMFGCSPCSFANLPQRGTKWHLRHARPVYILLFTTCLAVPRESPDFDPELHVPDMSESEDVPMAERSEAEIGCHWTSRLKLQLCGGDGECHDGEILAFDFQRRAWAYYESLSEDIGTAASKTAGLAKAPPLEEAFWIATMPPEELMSSAELCPGLVVVALLLVAEVHYAVREPPGPGRFNPLDAAKSMMSLLEQHKPSELDTLMAMWPAEAARERADAVRSMALVRSQRRPPSVDIVIARCHTSLHWLWEVPLPSQARLLIYEKCSRPEGELERQLAGVVSKVASIAVVSALDHGEWMTGECGAYLQHMIATRSGSEQSGQLRGPADFTVFIHDDAPRHLKPEFLGLVFRSLELGSYNVPFLNLAHERYVEASTPCLRDLYRRAFNRELTGRLSTYCCGHFVVSSSRLRAVPVDWLERLWATVSSGAHSVRAGG